jgi:hypothetical protein
MRILGLGLAIVLVAACGTDDGAHLTLVGPGSLGPVTKIEIVLASADPAAITTVSQRTSPAELDDEPATYYRQRASGGVIGRTIDDANGLQIRIAPNPTEYPDESYVPFVILYNADTTVVGIATFHGTGEPMPQPIAIRAGELDSYALDLEPMTAADPNGPIAGAQALAVDCVTDVAGTWRSGFAWRPAAGSQLRLLLPDLGADPGATDAMGRALDLDCDGHAAVADDRAADCDDTRARFNRDATEACDGEDTNCDDAQFYVTSCTVNGTCLNPVGQKLCDDSVGVEGQCTPDPSCVCAGNPGSCARCIVDHLQQMSSTTLTPCQPAVGVIKLQQFCSSNEPCSVQVASTAGGWGAQVALTGTTSMFAKRVVNVVDTLQLQIKRPEGPNASILGMPGHNAGRVDLVVTDTGGTPHLYSIDLQHNADFSAQCPTNNGVIVMTCTP